MLNCDPLLEEKIKILLLVMDTNISELMTAIHTHEKETGRAPEEINVPINLTFAGVKINFINETDKSIVTIRGIDKLHHKRTSL